MKKTVLMILALLLSALLVCPVSADKLGTQKKQTPTPAPVLQLSSGYARANGQIYAETAMMTELAEAENALVYVSAWQKLEDGAFAATVRFVSRDGIFFNGCIPMNALLMLSDDAASRFLEGLDVVTDGKVTLSGYGVTMFYEEKAEPAVLVLTAQPADQAISADGSAVFSVAAAYAESESVPVLTYQWQEKQADGEWSNVGFAGGQEQELAVPGSEAKDGTSYRCVVSDAEGGMIISDAAVLTVVQTETASAQTSDAPVFLLEPKDVTVAPEGRAVFTVEADRPVTYQWQVLVVGADAWTETSLGGNQSAELSFTAKAQYNGRRFRCVVTDGNGYTAVSADALLTVTGENGAADAAATAAPDPAETAPAEENAILFTLQPEDTAVELNRKATFTVETNLEKGTYRWQMLEKGEWVATKLSGYKTKTLSFAARNQYNGYAFRCVVTDKEGNTAISDPAVLTILYDGEFAIVTQPANVEVQVNKTCAFTVYVNHAGCAYQWQQLDGEEWVNSKVSGNQKYKASFAAREAYDQKQFRCVVTDESGATFVTEPVTLSILFDNELAIVTQPKDASVAVGKKVSFSCWANRVDVSYRWQIQLEEDGEWIAIGTEETSTSVLSFTMTTDDAGHSFRCIVTDAQGNELISNAAKLTLKE